MACIYRQGRLVTHTVAFLKCVSYSRLCKCVGHWLSFPDALVVHSLSTCVGCQSFLPTVWVAGGAFQLCESLIVLPSLWLTGGPSTMSTLPNDRRSSHLERMTGDPHIWTGRPATHTFEKDNTHLQRTISAGNPELFEVQAGE